MCGITGFFLKDGASAPPSLLEEMTGSLAHRGPDGFGHWRDSTGQVGLGHRRLAIIDLSPSGAQPMASPDGRYLITFNGEIYNYLELRSQWDEARFRSRSDTEVLLAQYESHGVSGLTALNGMFALAIFDNAERELLLARDPMGIKPLYYYQDYRGLFFASELRALLVAMVGKPVLRRDLLSRYLKANWVPGPDTLLEGVRKLEPGHYLRVKSDLSLTQSPFYQWDYQPDLSLTLSAWEDALDAALEGALDRQMRSDVPVGFFLSGGVDSSLLLAKGVKRSSRATAFTVGFRWSEGQDTQLDLESARRLRQRIPFEHREILLEPSILSVLPKVVAALEEPIADPAALCSYLICEAAAREFKVLISGQGSDELFGGYPLYRNALVTGFLPRIPHLPATGRLGKLFSAMSAPWPEPYFELRSAMPGNESEGLLHPEISQSQQPPFATHYEHYARAKRFDRLHQLMYLDIKTYMVATNLTYSDKTSMASSVELRVPFLDLEMASLVQRMPSHFKVSFSGGKPLLKKLARRYLPEEIVYRKKTGFGLPLREWMRKDLQPLARDLLSAERLERQRLFRPEVPERWLKEHQAGTVDHSMRLYSLMVFELWMESLGI